MFQTQVTKNNKKQPFRYSYICYICPDTLYMFVSGRKLIKKNPDKLLIFLFDELIVETKLPGI